MFKDYSRRERTVSLSWESIVLIIPGGASAIGVQTIGNITIVYSKSDTKEISNTEEL